MNNTPYKVRHIRCNMTDFNNNCHRFRFEYLYNEYVCICYDGTSVVFLQDAERDVPDTVKDEIRTIIWNKIDTEEKTWRYPKQAYAQANQYVIENYYGYLTELRFTVLMDRQILIGDNTHKGHHISFGGFEITVNGKEICFDFCHYEGKKQSSTIIEAWLSEFDTEFSTSTITQEEIQNADWNEFCVYTGENDELEIYPLRILSLWYIFNNQYTIQASPQELVKINSALCVT